MKHRVLFFRLVFFFFLLSLMCVIHISVNEHKHSAALSSEQPVSQPRSEKGKRKTCARLHRANCFIGSPPLINDCGSYRTGLSPEAWADVQAITPRARMVISALPNRSALSERAGVRIV